MYQSLRRPLVLAGHFILIGTMVAFSDFIHLLVSAV